ncbi:GNAT family N-acetyltransferase [Rhizobium beringeri]|jgi:GNAT superfamily N-acetyltransferase|uniref:GNAT family N-acetyltransferase n=3 Tax=Rhizobium TaxID=379 RepID=A0A7Z0ZTV8_9HYPH|nr:MULTISPECIES: GNAT family N-acetyltransferase [Rhizobium]MBA5803719.1 GNAT family N-acetyltransferase [Rhizobium changzhiense]MBY5459181.1 GNAT family N-acetyltransferase [Rhizobium leguminosarum]MCH4549596.1 GNAT family N-acetyltransferase [Rhizobium changzhiense]MCW0019500.1 GNAT family N-acetyltransferase [Rhizobium sp. BT-226]NKL61363.1 GNAT family N-acetyltransferase [Rhizobium leguminosarum bv. viciae]
MSFRIELLVAKHVSGAADVLVNAYALPPWNENWSLEAAAENVTYVLQTPRSVALVAVDEGKVLGIALGIRQRRHTGPVIYLDELSVQPDAQGKGIGTALLSAMFETAKAEGCSSVWLISQRGGALSEFYQRSGFAMRSDLGIYSRSSG